MAAFRNEAAYEVNLRCLKTVLLVKLCLIVIEFCEPNEHEWRSAERASAIEY
jgi:hypothetical protein